MKLLYLLILLLIPLMVWSGEDTTKAYCGDCINIGNSTFQSGTYDDFSYGDGVYGIISRFCKRLPLNCRWECIDGDLYRICKTEEPEDTVWFKFEVDWTDSDTTRDAVYKFHPFNPNSLDTIRVADTIFFDDWGYKPIYRDSVVQVCDTTVWVRWTGLEGCGLGAHALFLDSIASRDSSYSLINCGRYFACVYYRDSVVVTQRRK